MSRIRNIATECSLSHLSLDAKLGQNTGLPAALPTENLIKIFHFNTYPRNMFISYDAMLSRLLLFTTV
jgi:hypothetical protein